MNHTPIYWFLLGFLSSEATDAAALAAFLVTLFIVIRHYPHKIWQCQRIADTVFRLFAGSKAAIFDRNAEDADGVPRADQEYEDEEEPEDGKEPEYEPEEDEPTPEEYPLKPFPVGTGVLVRDPDPMHAGYGVCVGTVKSFTWRSVGVLVYAISVLDKTLTVVSDLVTEDLGVIPEGTGVMFYSSSGAVDMDAQSIPKCMHGITFKANVVDGELIYTVEYPIKDRNVGQMDVPATQVWKE